MKFNKRISISKPLLGKEEKDLALKAISDGHISGTAGNFVGRFEKEFAHFCGCMYGIATPSGATALHLALATLNIGSGDEVLVPSFTNMAAFFAVHYLGATPIPVDIEPDTLNINPNLIEKRITSHTKAILIVHLYGHPADMNPISKIARKHKLFLIEDGAEAHGAEYKGKKVGSLSDVGCFSFYANKIITTGEGGMVVTNDRNLAERARALGSMAYGRDNRFEHTDVGFSYRMSNVLAAIGCAQIKKAENTIKIKRAMADFYNRELAGTKGLQLPQEKAYAKNVYWVYHLILQEPLTGLREKIMKVLSGAGIDVRETFIPYHEQTMSVKKGFTCLNDYPVASYVGQNGFYLPCYPGLKRSDQKYITNILKSAINAGDKEI